MYTPSEQLQVPFLLEQPHADIPPVPSPQLLTSSTTKRAPALPGSHRTAKGRNPSQDSPSEEDVRRNVSFLGSVRTASES